MSSLPALSFNSGLDTFLCLEMRSQHFRYTPGLRNAATGTIGWLRIENLTNRADTSVIKVRAKRGQQIVGLRLVTAHSESGVDIMADQPRPDGALMIGRVSRTEIARIRRLIVEMIR